MSSNKRKRNGAPLWFIEKHDAPDMPDGAGYNWNL